MCIVCCFTLFVPGDSQSPIIKASRGWKKSTKHNCVKSERKNWGKVLVIYFSVWGTLKVLYVLIIDKVEIAKYPTQILSKIKRETSFYVNYFIVTLICSFIVFWPVIRNSINKFSLINIEDLFGTMRKAYT